MTTALEHIINAGSWTVDFASEAQNEEQEVPKEHLESHMTAHSSEILPWLYLGGPTLVLVGHLRGFFLSWA